MIKKAIKTYLYKSEKKTLDVILRRDKITVNTFIDDAIEYFKKLNKNKTDIKFKFNDFEKVKIHSLSPFVSFETADEAGKLAEKYNTRKPIILREIICIYLDKMSQ